jgi:hypothetical protein
LVDFETIDDPIRFKVVKFLGNGVAALLTDGTKEAEARAIVITR